MSTAIPDGFEEVIPDGFEEVEAPKSKSYISQLGKDTLGTLAGIGDVVSGIPKMGAQMALTAASKIASPSHNLDELWNASGDVIDHAVPTLGKAFNQGTNGGYNSVMYPFNKFSQGIDYVADKIPNKDVAGAVKMGAMFAPIPFAGKIGRGLGKAVETIDPGLRNAGKKVIPSDKVSGLEKDLNTEVIPQGFEEVSPQMELPLENSAQQVSEVRSAKQGQGDLFSPVNEPLQNVIPPTSKDIPRTPEQLEIPLQNSAQQAAEMQARGVGQSDLFSPVNEATQTRVPEVSQDPYTPKGVETIAQHELFDQSEMGRVANPYEATPGDWRVDENGIPIKADLSMEAANLENPLQRNLWGDELQQKSNPVGQSANLFDTSSQQQGVPLTESIDSMDWAHRRGAINSQLKGDIEAPGVMNAAIAEANRRGGNQSGAIDIQAIADGLKKIRDSIQSISLVRDRIVAPPEQQPDTINTPRSPETIAARQDTVRKVQAGLRDNPVLGKKLQEYDSPATIEEVRSILDSNPNRDINGSITGKHIRENGESGIRSKSIKTNSPMLRYANRALTDARASAMQFSQKYITGKDGFAKVAQSLKPKELAEVIKSLKLGDKKQTYLTREQLSKHGFNENQIRTVEAYYRADKGLLEQENSARRSLGMEEIKERPGHFPGIFNGSYKTLVMDGKDKPIAVIATDTAWSHNMAKAKVKDLHPDAKFLTKERWFNQTYGKRTPLGGNQVRSDLFSGMNDVMQLLAEKDPKFAELQQTINDTINQRSNSLYGFNKHELDKKGILGNEGNKPWRSPEENARDALKASLQYFEEGAQHYNLLSPLNDLSNLVKDYGDKLPNTTKYLSDYLEHVQGRSTSPLGQAINTILDKPFDMIGVGSKIPLKIAGEIKNRMSQIFMGFGNYGFTLAQWAQVGQSGAPFMELARQRLGMSLPKAVKAASDGAVGFMGSVLENMTGKNLKVDQFSRDAFKYAQDRGLLSFSELENAHESLKPKALRTLDSVADINMKLGEQGSRPVVFMGFAHMLRDAGFPQEQAFRVAENLTQTAMIDYHPWERPRMYAKLGVLGQFAGGLTTFKHGYINQNLILGKEASKGNITPILASGAAMLALAGVTGLPFYGEADTLYQHITEALGDRKTIREGVLNPLTDSESLKTGLLSAATNLNWQSKFSSADMIPDTLAKGASPHLEAFSRIIMDALDAANHSDSQSTRNLISDVSPNGPIKGIVESALSKSDNGELITRQGDRGYPRTERDWRVRQAIGMTSNDEAINKQSGFEFHNKEAAISKKHADISNDIKRAVKNGTDTDRILNSKLYDEYVSTGGTDRDFIQLLRDTEINSYKSQEERDAGNPLGSKRAADKYIRYYEKEHK